jgi:hypothetical protein
VTRRPSWIIVFGAFLAACAAGVTLAQFELSFAGVLGLGFLAIALLGAIALGLEAFRQTRPARANPHARRPDV